MFNILLLLLLDKETNLFQHKSRPMMVLLLPLMDSIFKKIKKIKMINFNIQININIKYIYNRVYNI